MAHIADSHENHPGPRLYIIVAALLGILTLIEVGAFFLEMSSWIVVWILLLLSLTKFLMVVFFFMHLRMDDNRFALLFFAPMIVMVSIAVALLAVFQNITR
jgi:cytochrome c oxidase subunit IV